MSQVARRALGLLLLGGTLVALSLALKGAFNPAPRAVPPEVIAPAALQDAGSDQRHWALLLGMLVLGLSVNARRRR